MCEITLLAVQVRLKIVVDYELGSSGFAALCRSHTKQRCGLSLASYAVPADVLTWLLLGCPA